MKRNLWSALAAILLCTSAGTLAQPCLIISEVVDGDLPGGLPKFVELTNTGSTSIDLAGYSLGVISNGNLTGSAAPTTLSGYLLPGHSYVTSFANDDLPPTGGTFYITYGFYPDNDAPSALFNGNDVIVLYQGNPGPGHGGTAGEGAIDVYGVIGEDGLGKPWDYTDGYTSRNSNIASPTSTFNVSDWDVHTKGLDFLPIDVYPGLTTPGAHSFPSGVCGAGLQVGRCCLGFDCLITTAADCATLSGTFGGVGSTCDGQPCGTPPAVGACCLGDTCERLTQADCLAASGTYKGDDTYCRPSPCLTCVSIPEAKLLPLGSEVQFCELVVTNIVDTISSTANKNFQAQAPDNSGAITIFGPNAPINNILDTGFLLPGDTIRIQGVTDEFSGLFEIGEPFAFNYDPNTPVNGDVLARGNGTPPDPVSITPAQFDEQHESMYVEIECATFNPPPGVTTFFVGNFPVLHPDGEFTVRVSTTDIANNMPGSIPTGPVNITGILSYFNGWQLLVLGQPGEIDEDPNCLLVGACCLPPNHDTCMVLSQADCTAMGGVGSGPGGVWVGGTRCSPNNPCGTPTGACCLTTGSCELVSEADCTSMGGGYQGDYTPCGNCALPGAAGDIAFGLSNIDPRLTAEQIRDGQVVGHWAQHGFLQSMEYDNADDIQHNARGNLLGLNFGNATTGWELYNVATDGTSVSQDVLFQCNTTYTGTPDLNSRGGGLAVAPNNKLVSVFNYDDQKLVVLKYNAGAAIGSGTGASVSNPAWIQIAARPQDTYSTAWYWDPANYDPNGPQYCLVAAGQDGGLVNIDLVTIPNSNTLDPNTWTVTTKAVVTGPFTNSITDIEYNPAVSPYIFVLLGMEADFTTFLGIIDPRTTPWTVVRGNAPGQGELPIDLTTCGDTGRECALGPDGYLYWSQYGSVISRIPVSDPNTFATLSCSSAESYYTSTQFASYSGIDVGFAPQIVLGACCVNASCSQTTESDCDTLGGTWLLGQSCTPNPCCSASILAAKALGANQNVALCNVIVNTTTDLISSSASKSFNVQEVNGLGGTTVFGSNAAIDALLNDPNHPIVPGDIVNLTGVSTIFNGLYELGTPLTIEKVGSATVAPAVITVADMLDDSPTAESYESMLVQLNCVKFQVTGNFASGTNYLVTADNGATTAVVRVATAGLDLVGKPIPTDAVNVAGVLSQFDSSDPRTGGYQLLMRGLADITPCAPAICLGDVNCDGAVTFADIDPFVARLGCPNSNPAACNTGCPWQAADINNDGAVTFADIDPFVGTLGNVCP